MLANKTAIKNENISNKELAEKLQETIIKISRKKIRSSFINNTWGADLADMQLTNKFDKGIRF